MTSESDVAPFGFLNVWKESGPTSAQVGYRLRAVLHDASGRPGKARDLPLGHFGTLDPGAAGVLPIAVGKATRLFPLIADRRKRYAFTLVLGRRTASGDLTGEVLEERPVAADAASSIEGVAARFLGESLQTPPMFSAVHHGGRRLYELARAGQTVERVPRRITIGELTVLGAASERVRMRVECSEGTYVRALCEDLAAAIGQVGCMDELVREAAGPFSAATAMSREQIEGDPLGALLDPRRVLPLPELTLSAEELRRFAVGMAVELRDRLPPADAVFALDGDGRIVGVGRATGAVFAPERVFIS